MNVTVRKIGNSEGVILPKEMLERHNLKAGDKLEVFFTSEGITLKPTDTEFEDQMEAARRMMDKYKVVFQKLAE